MHSADNECNCAYLKMSWLVFDIKNEFKLPCMQAHSVHARECSWSDNWSPCICWPRDPCANRQSNNHHVCAPARGNPNDRRETDQMHRPRTPEIGGGEETINAFDLVCLVKIRGRRSSSVPYLQFYRLVLVICHHWTGWSSGWWAKIASIPSKVIVLSDLDPNLMNLVSVWISRFLCAHHSKDSK